MPQIDDLHGDAQAIRNAAVLGDERKIGFREGGEADQFAAVIVKGKELEARFWPGPKHDGRGSTPASPPTISKRYLCNFARCALTPSSVDGA